MKNGLFVCLLACLVVVGGCATTARAESVSAFCNVLDYGALADGQTDDTSAIQSAVDKCSTVYFPAGNYLIGEPVEITKNKTTLLGDGDDTQLIKKSLGQGSLINIENKKEIEIKDITFQGPGVATHEDNDMVEAIAIHVVYGRDIVIQNNFFSGFNGSGVVRVTGNSAYDEPTKWSKDIEIRNNRFENNLDRLNDHGEVAANAIYLLSGVKDFVIENNVVDASLQKVGIAAHSNIRNGVIRNNRVYNNGADSDSVHAYGIMVYAFPEAHSNFVTVENNVVSNAANMGIYVKGEQSHHFTVRHNVVDHCDYRSDDVTLPAGSISLNEVSDTVIEENWITNVTTIGVQVFRTNQAKVKVADNFISGTPKTSHAKVENSHFKNTRGVVLRSGSNPLSSVRIENNIIEEIDDAICWWVPFKDKGDLSSIVIRQNKISGAKRGITSLDLVPNLDYATGFLISGNRFEDCTYGMHITYLSTSLIVDNTFTDCQTPIWLKDGFLIKEEHNRVLPEIEMMKHFQAR